LANSIPLWKQLASSPPTRRFSPDFSTLRYRDLLVVLPAELVEGLKGDDDSLLLYAKYVVRGRAAERTGRYILQIATFAFRTPSSSEALLPEHIEEKGLHAQREGLPPAGSPTSSTKYAAITNGVLREGLKNRLKASNSAIIEYGRIQRSYGRTLDTGLQDSLAGDSHRLYELASSIIGGRLPEHLESTMSDGSQLYQYARMVIKGRLPSNSGIKTVGKPRLLRQVRRGYRPWPSPGGG
jgi:hypothetical protein